MKKRIHKAALSLFLRDGIEKVTMRKIAAKIRYSPATLYNYYKNKNDIFLALRREGFAIFLTYQEKSRNFRSPRKRILAHGRAYMEFAIENPQLYELMFIISAPMSEASRTTEREKTMQSFEYLKDDIAACMKDRLIKRGNIDAMALAYWSAGHGLASLLIRDRLTMFDTKVQVELVKKASDLLNSSMIPPKRSDKK